MTSNGRRPKNIKSWISQQSLIGSYSKLKLKIRGPNQNWKLLAMKTTSNGRLPQNLNIGIYYQPLIGPSSTFKLKLRGPNQNWNCL